MSGEYVPVGTNVSKPTEVEQVREIKRASQATQKAFDLRPCLTQEEFIYRIFVVEKPVIDKMILEGHPVKEILYYWSDLTAEAHALPVFASDSIQDVVNRYSDFFPREIQTFIEEVKKTNQVLHDSKGFSDNKDLMIKLKCPVGLYRALIALDPDFWHNKRNVNYFKRAFRYLVGIGLPKGTQV